MDRITDTNLDADAEKTPIKIDECENLAETSVLTEYMLEMPQKPRIEVNHMKKILSAR